MLLVYLVKILQDTCFLLFPQITRSVHFQRLCILIIFVKIQCLNYFTEYLIKINLESIMINELKASLIEIQSDCIFILNIASDYFVIIVFVFSFCNEFMKNVVQKQSQCFQFVSKPCFTSTKWYNFDRNIFNGSLKSLAATWSCLKNQWSYFNGLVLGQVLINCNFFVLHLLMFQCARI